MKIDEIIAAPWNDTTWRNELETLVRDVLTFSPMSTAQLFAKLGVTDKAQAGKLRSRLHSIKITHLADAWRYSGEHGKFRDGSGARVQLVEWYKATPRREFAEDEKRAYFAAHPEAAGLKPEEEF